MLHHNINYLSNLKYNFYFKKYIFNTNFNYNYLKYNKKNYI